MPSTVSGTVGLNFYFDGDKLNEAPIPVVGNTFTYDGLDSDTDYADKLTVTAVDAAGNESAPSTLLLHAFTEDTTPPDDPMSEEDTDAIDALVTAAKASGGQPGITIAITGPRGFYTKSYGSGVFNDAHFRMGSITKTFTSTAILQQVDAGHLTLDDTLDTYVPGIPNGENITIRHLLMMQSGVVDDQSNPTLKLQVILSPTGAWSAANTLAYIKGSSSGFDPGTSFQYVNSNYILLGYVLEAVTGRKIRDILTQDIIVPLGLLETSWPAGSGLPAPAATGYKMGLLGLGLIPTLTNATAINPQIFGAAGALVTTISDLIKWGKELRDGTLLSTESQATRMTISRTGPGVQHFPGPNGPVQYDYGLGFYQVESWFGHDGSIPGFDCCVSFEPHSGTVIAVMENFQTNGLLALSRVWYDIAHYLYPESTELMDYLTPQTVSLDTIPSPTDSAAGSLNVITWKPRGDEDGAIGLPHKVPYALWSPIIVDLPRIPAPATIGEISVHGPPQIIRLDIIPAPESSGAITVTALPFAGLPHVVPHPI